MKTYKKGARQHGIAALLASLKVLKELLLPLLVLFVSQGFRAEGEGWALYWRLVAGVVLLLGAFLWGFLQWWSFRYRVEDGQLRVDQGVIVKKNQSIPVERIQTVDFSEGLLHRAFGLVKVQVQTAGGARPEAVLAAVTKAEANRLERLLRPGTRTEGALEQSEENRREAAPTGTEDRGVEWLPKVFKGAADAAGGQAAYKLPVGRLLLAGLTANNMGVAISLLIAALSQADELFPGIKVFQRVAESSGSRAFLMVGAAALLLAWIMAVAGSVLRFACFTLVKQGDELLITRGLLERRKVTLPVSRIQAVRIVQEIVWKPFRLAAVHVVCAGYGNHKGESTLLFPLMKLKEIEPFLQQICPAYAADPSAVSYRKVSRRAVWGYVLPIPLSVGAATALISLFSIWGLYGVPVTAAALLLGWMSYRRAGYACNERLLIIRRRWLTKTVVIVPRRRVQYFSVMQNPFQRRSGLSSFRVSLAATVFGVHFGLKGLPMPEAMKLLEWSGRRPEA